MPRVSVELVDLSRALLLFGPQRGHCCFSAPFVGVMTRTFALPPMQRCLRPGFVLCDSVMGLVKPFSLLTIGGSTLLDVLALDASRGGSSLA